MITWEPVVVRAAQLTSSTVPYPDTGETAWVTATAYVAGDTRSHEVDGLLHKFEVKQNHTSSASNAPKAFPNENAYWTDLGAVNRYKMFLLERNQQTESASPLVVEITPGERVGAIAASRIVADSLQVQVYDGATLLYDETHDLIDRTVYGWQDWLFQPFRQRANFIAVNLPVLTTATVKLTFTKASGNVKVGPTCIGMPFNVGDMEFKPQIRERNFTVVERDAFGNATFDIKLSVPQTSGRLTLKKARINQVMGLIDSLNGRVTCWSGLDDNVTDDYFNALFLIGFYRRKEYILEGKQHFAIDIDIEGI